MITNYVGTRTAAGNVDGTLGDELVVDVPGAGIWMWRNNSVWQQLHPAASNALVVADIDGSGKADVIISFPGQGIWRLHERRDGCRSIPAFYAISPPGT